MTWSVWIMDYEESEWNQSQHWHRWTKKNAKQIAIIVVNQKAKMQVQNQYRRVSAIIV